MTITSHGHFQKDQHTGFGFNWGMMFSKSSQPNLGSQNDIGIESYLPPLLLHGVPHKHVHHLTLYVVMW